MQHRSSIIISEEEYLELYKDSKLLYHLMSNGVDNWDGYEAAQEACAEEENI